MIIIKSLETIKHSENQYTLAVRFISYLKHLVHLQTFFPAKLMYIFLFLPRLLTTALMLFIKHGMSLVP